MKKRTIVPLPRDEMFVEKITCDFCEAPIDHMQRYEEDAVTIEHKEGFNSPDGGCGTIRRVDMCPRCFYGVFKDWLDSCGVEMACDEWDW
jgi:hypothetical protein